MCSSVQPAANSVVPELDLSSMFVLFGSFGAFLMELRDTDYAYTEVCTVPEAESSSKN